MNDEMHTLNEQQLRARESVRALSRPSAREEFRAELRASFVGTSVRRPSSRSVRRPGSMSAWVPRPWQLVAAAAALILVFMNRGPSWEVLGSEGIEHVLVDGTAVPLDRLQDELRPGRQVQLPGPGRLDLASATTLFFQLEDEIAVRLPRSPRRWIGRSVEASVEGSGRLRVLTGSGFSGAKLSMNSPSAEWEVVGTCFTVIAQEGLLCLCVLDGEVRACASGGEMEAIPAGQRATFIGSSPEVDHGPMREDEREALQSLAARAATLLGP